MAGARFDAGPLRGEIHVPGDKSISHRALMLAARAHGVSRIENPNRGADVAATRDALRALGAAIEDDGDGFAVCGGPLHDPAETIDARNSGTTVRLLMGLCAGAAVDARFDGDASLRRRPMERVAEPLRALGAQVETTGGRLPVRVRGTVAPAEVHATLGTASAQVKSAILLAALDAAGTVIVSGDRRTRDHTERMLRHMGRMIRFDGERIELEPGVLRAATIHVPGDLSAAAFFIVAAAITPGSDILVRDAGVNPTRSGLIEALQAMGADLTLERPREVGGEPFADIRVRHRALGAIEVGGSIVVRAIDEVPALCVAAAYAHGTTRIRDAAELRLKESDRIAAMAETLRRCGIRVSELPDGIEIEGGGARPPSGVLPSFGDHRIAMSVAALAAPTGAHTVDDGDCIAISFPEFEDRWSAAQAR